MHRRVVLSVLLAFVLAAFVAHAHVVHEARDATRYPLSVDAELGNPFPQCVDLATAADDCPIEILKVPK